MTDQAQVKSLIDTAYTRFGRIDMVINNAGQAAVGPVATINPDHYRQIIELNLLGPLHMMQAAVPKMKSQGGGVIINISSNVSKMAILFTCHGVRQRLLRTREVSAVQAGVARKIR